MLNYLLDVSHQGRRMGFHSVHLKHRIAIEPPELWSHEDPITSPS